MDHWTAYLRLGTGTGVTSVADIPSNFNAEISTDGTTGTFTIPKAQSKQIYWGAFCFSVIEIIGRREYRDVQLLNM